MEAAPPHSYPRQPSTTFSPRERDAYDDLRPYSSPNKRPVEREQQPSSNSSSPPNYSQIQEREEREHGAGFFR
ncbi:hypothetical protein C8R44DRAFT_881382 [Mycena epipterygia]|nr:hypothetical protein C8R44DRAFT_881382 [Mycena epipterygia]